MLLYKDIPAGALKEIEEHYPTIDISNYNGEINDDLVSRYIRFRNKINETNSMTYIVRGEISEGMMRLYGVYESGLVKNTE